MSATEQRAAAGPRRRRIWRHRIAALAASLCTAVPAVAGPLADKAAGYAEWTPTWHRLGYGAIAETFFTDDGLTEVTRLRGLVDSTIWTGTYLGAQALRYRTTGEEDALSEVVSAVDTLHHHLEVTGRPGFIARFRGPNEPPFNRGYPGEHWYPGQGRYAGDIFLTNTSRDQYTGWFFGMALAYDALEGVNEPVRRRIRTDVAEVVDALIAQRWFIVDLDGWPTTKAPNVLPPQQAAWAMIAAHVTGEPRFAAEYERLAAPEMRSQHRLASISWPNKYVQHYGNNLAHTNMYILMRLARFHERREDYAFWTQLFRSQTHRHWHGVHNPWYEMVHVSIGGPPGDDVVAQIVDDLTRFRAAPNRHIAPEQPVVELDPVSLALVELVEEYPVLGQLFETVKPQALEAFPVDQQCPEDFLWQRNPWSIDCQATDLAHVDPGVDYLIAYWMARHHGVIDASH